MAGVCERRGSRERVRASAKVKGRRYGRTGGFVEGAALRKRRSDTEDLGRPHRRGSEGSGRTLAENGRRRNVQRRTAAGSTGSARCNSRGWLGQQAGGRGRRDSPGAGLWLFPAVH